MGKVTPAMVKQLDEATKVIAAAADAVTKGTTAFPLLKSFVAPDASSIAAFTASTTAIVTALGSVAQGFKAKWLEQATLFFDAASKGVGLVAAGVDGLTKLRTFRAPSVAAVNDFTDTVVVIVQSLGSAAQVFKDAWLTHAQIFFDTAGKGLGIIGSGVDGLTKLRTFKAPSIAAVNAFTDSTLILVQSLGTAAKAFKETWLAHASLFEETAAKGVAILGAGVDGLLKLATFKAPSIAAVNAFTDTVTILIQSLGTVAAVFKDAWLTHAGVFADAVAKGVGIIGTSVDGFLKLSSYVGIPRTALTQFAADLTLVMQKMIDIARDLGVKGPAAAAVFGDAVGKTIAPIGAAIDTFAKLTDYKGVAPAAVQLIGNDIAGVIGFLGVIAQQANSAGVAAAVAFSTSVGVVFAGLKSGLDTLTALGNYKGVAAKQVELLVDDILEIVKMTGTLAYQAGAAESAALEWENHLGGYHERIVAGLNSISTLNGLTATATIHAQTRIVEGSGGTGGSGGTDTSTPGAPPPPPTPGIKFDHFARGVQNYIGGLAVVGEQGRELVNIPPRGGVIPHAQTEALLAGRSGTTVATLPARDLDPIVGAIEGAIHQAAVAIVSAINGQQGSGNYQTIASLYGGNG
jgi:hypothetical protein